VGNQKARTTRFSMGTPMNSGLTESVFAAQIEYRLIISSGKKENKNKK
jgi:hypothetical protein